MKYRSWGSKNLPGPWSAAPRPYPSAATAGRRPPRPRRTLPGDPRRHPHQPGPACGLDRALRVAWTMADLAGRDHPTRLDVRTALVLRTGVQRGLPAAERSGHPETAAGSDLGAEP
ncbi:hypothetical protein ACIGZJ_05155 [Kitasatospora sp. NPDC052868]|uniref:magnesium chelatase subunit ChlI family protein n=1 Tax=Kitasatospora sp. NPDC052868 TaxID=3364060 RepID=UPI0037C7939D